MAGEEEVYGGAGGELVPDLDSEDEAEQTEEAEAALAQVGGKGGGGCQPPSPLLLQGDLAPPAIINKLQRCNFM